MKHILQERFPSYGAVLPTSASTAQAMDAVGDAAMEAGDIVARTPDEYRVRLRAVLWTPIIRIRVVPSVAGANVYVRVAEEAVWRTLHWTMLLMTLALAGVSLILGEAIAAAVVTACALCVSVCSMWWIGHVAVGIVRDALPG